MRISWAWCALALVSGFGSVATPSAERVTVRVVDPAGKRAMAGAGLSCLDPAGPGATVGADGRLPVLGTCKQVRCWADGYLPGEATVNQATVECWVKGAVTLRGAVRGLAATEGMEARLYAAGAEVPAAREALVSAVEPGGSARLAVGPVETGRYHLEIVRVADGWTCRAELGALAHGSHAIDAHWRPPVTVRGKVLTAENQPVQGIKVRARRETPISPMFQRVPRQVFPPVIGAWTCGLPALMDKRAAADGTISFPADPEGPLVLVAGEWDDGLGIAVAHFQRAPTEQVTLRPRLPVGLSARLDYEDDGPAACRAALELKSPDAQLAAALIPGAAMEARCAADGGIRLGPFLGSDWEVGFRPEPGLHLLMRGDAPAPGATVELGRLVVDRGVTLLVEVVDRAGAPIQDARVFGSGSAGLVIGVEATTNRDGRAELAGLPQGASLRVEVSAEGYLAATREGIDEGPDPVRIELARGAHLEGRVVGASGEAVGGAEVSAFAAASRAPASTRSNEDGSFRIDAAEAGRLTVAARAEGYGRAAPVEIDATAGETRSGIVIELGPVSGVRGRVEDASGRPVAGAAVVLSSQRDVAIDASAPVIARTSTTEDGRFLLSADPEPLQWVSARAPGHATAVVSAAPAIAGEAIELVLPPAGAVEVRLADSVAPTRQVAVTDGARVRHSALGLGRSSILFEGLGAGSGEAALPPGEATPVEIVAGSTTVVELREGAVLEGTVTQDGRPLPRFLVAVASVSEAGIGLKGSTETDVRGEWRWENLGPGSYRISAVGPQGRAERRVDVPRDGTLRVDLSVTSVIVDAHVRNARSGEPIASEWVSIQPTGVVCNSTLGTWMAATGDSHGVALHLTDNGCGAGPLDAQGRARIAMEAPGPHTVVINTKGYQPLREEVELRAGTNALELALTPSSAPVVRVRMHSDPPGLPGTLNCLQGNSRSNYGGVSGTVTCGSFSPGPAEVIFRVDGFGIGRTAFEVPEDGEIEVIVTAVRSGQLLVGRQAESAARPVVLDTGGLDWGGVLTRSGEGAIQPIESPELGPAWLVRYLPPGEYTVSLDGRPRGRVFVDPGSTTVVP